MADKMPSWKRGQQEQELETWKELHRHGERESRQQTEYSMQGDYLGLEDGRPGVSWNPLFGGFIMPVGWRVAIYIAGLALLALIVFGWRACVGEERINELRGQATAHAEPAQSGDSGTEGN